MKITNIHSAMTAQVHGHVVAPGQALDGAVAEDLLNAFPGVGAMFGCGVLEGDDEAVALVASLRASDQSLNASSDQGEQPKAKLGKGKGKPGPKAKAGPEPVPEPEL